MSDPFSAPQTAPLAGPEDRIDLDAMGPLRWARWTLMVVGVLYLLMAVGFTPLFIWSMGQDPEAQLSGVAELIIGLVMFVFIAGFGVLNFVAVWGLGKGAKWGWFVALILGGMYLPSGCMPFGAVILYGLLNDKVRKAYLD